MSDNKCRVASQVAGCKVLASARACEACQQAPHPQAVNVVTLGMAIVHRKRLGKPIANHRNLMTQYKPTGEEPVSFRINDFRPGPSRELSLKKCSPGSLGQAIRAGIDLSVRLEA